VLEGDDARSAVAAANRRTLSRHELAAAHAAFDAVSPGVGEYDQAAFDLERERDLEEALDLLNDLAHATDPALRRQARAAAACVFLRMSQLGRPSRRGVRRLTHEVTDHDGDLDVDRTLERAGGRRPTRQDLTLTRWRASDRAICLLIDRSGSMRGRAMAMAAVATASTVLAASEQASCSVIAFANQAIVLQPQQVRRSLPSLIDDIISLRGAGTTDLANALTAARAQLARARATDRTVVLLSDCLQTSGSDAMTALSGLDAVHVLTPSLDPAAIRAGRALASRAGGRFTSVDDPKQLPAALTTLLA